MNFTDLTGKKINHWTVLSLEGKDKSGNLQWCCMCFCGNLRFITTGKLNSGHSKMCNECSHRSRRKSENEKTLSRRWSDYVCNSKKRGHKMDLTKAEFKKLTSKKCHYCGTMPKNFYNGLDRLDSKKGYSKYNVVPCCSTCNMLKGAKSYGEFIDAVSAISKNLGLR